MFMNVETDGSVILRPFQGLTKQAPPNDNDVLLVGVVDTETTGVDSLSRVIEIAVQIVAVHRKTGRIVGVFPGYNSLQDPGCPIPAEASAVNGIYAEDVVGKQIDWAHVAGLLELTDFNVAHNAAFDVPMVDAEMLLAKVPIPQVPWGCSLHMLEWDSPSKSLEVLCWLHNFTFSAHRATGDIQALAHLLDIGGRFLELYDRTVHPSYILRAEKSPFQSKDWLKSRKFQWADKCWSKEFPTLDAANACREEMSAAVYFPARNCAVIECVAPDTRFHKVVMGL